MKPETKRFLLGGLCGVALMFLCALLIELAGAQLRGQLHFPILVSHTAQNLFGSYWLAVLVQSVLCFALGGMVGIATMPFDEDGYKLLVNSLLHFGVTALLTFLLLVLCLGIPVDLLPEWLGMWLILYLVIWLGRYVGWYAEVAQIRAKLGLDPGPSVLKWKETLPYLPFLAFLCTGLPLSAPLWEALRVPVFSQFIFPLLVLPAGCFAAGMSLGKRQGFCPLYPVLALGLYLPTFFPVYNFSTLCECVLTAGFALAGNVAGVLAARLRKRG